MLFTTKVDFYCQLWKKSHKFSLIWCLFSVKRSYLSHSKLWDLGVNHQIWESHSRMRGQSSGLVTAADKIPAIGVLFAVDYDVIVRKPCFQRGTTHVFLKNFRSFLFKFFGQCHGVLILLQPIRIGPCGGGRSIFSSIPGIYFLFVLKACVTRMRRKSSMPQASSRLDYALLLWNIRFFKPPGRIW